MRGTFPKHQLWAQPWARNLWKNKKTQRLIERLTGRSNWSRSTGPLVSSTVTEARTQPEAIGESICKSSISTEFLRRSENFSGSQGIEGLPGRGNSRDRGHDGGNLGEPQA